jgi:hypothetical protein
MRFPTGRIFLIQPSRLSFSNPLLRPGSIGVELFASGTDASTSPLPAAHERAFYLVRCSTSHHSITVEQLGVSFN